ncbi:hypothetical protein [Streptomyces rugosispiralis]|uniref:Uncharacterized protein n=1 Tax=Streptomyces rugosispiralis TaxID=2967341 RepID=A0ABT1V4G5_9ACTN|nr:hypothetical protein [Streptomyces rugosispiralis]MCQ8192266.1 hypothetical protein [Streptomyces rugosispiralis]
MSVSELQTSGNAALNCAEYDHSARRGGSIGNIDADHTIDARHTARVERGRRQSTEFTVSESLETPGSIDAPGSIGATGSTLQEHFVFDPFLGSAAECNPGRTAV